MTKPNYVNRGGELVYAPPFVADNVQQYSFLLDAEMEALQGICDQYLNNPLKHTRFVPGGPFVMLSCCALPSLRSTTAPYSNLGWFAENEIAFWMLVIDQLEKRVFWMLPYIWVDNAFAFAMGRELYGFPKGLGTVTLPAGPDKADLFSIDTLALKQFSPDTKGEMVRMVQVNKIAGQTPSHPLIRETQNGIEEFMKEIISIADDGLSKLENFKLIMNTLDDLMHLNIPMIFLKEFRDVTHPSGVSFQSIVEAQAKMNRFHGGKVFHDAYDVDIAVCDSHPIRKDFGFPATGPLRSKLSFWVSYDFEIGLGTETMISGPQVS
jgi:hypothetical protein